MNQGVPCLAPDVPVTALVSALRRGRGEDLSIAGSGREAVPDLHTQID